MAGRAAAEPPEDLYDFRIELHYSGDSLLAVGTEWRGKLDVGELYDNIIAELAMEPGPTLVCVAVKCAGQWVVMYTNSQKSDEAWMQWCRSFVGMIRTGCLGRRGDVEA